MRSQRNHTCLRRVSPAYVSSPVRWTLLILLLLGLGGNRSSAQTIPAATATASRTLTTINGNSGHIAANSLGDVFWISQGSNIAYWLPRGTTAPQTLISGFSGGLRSIAVDGKNNVYVVSAYSPTAIIEVPYVSGTYKTGSTVTSSAGPAACTAIQPATVCSQFGSGGAALNYYFQAVDLGFDSANNAYLIDVYANGGCSGSCIVKFTPGTTSYTATVIKSNIAAQSYSAQIGVAPNGDVYFANGSVLDYIAAGTTTAMGVGTGLTNPTGVSVDQFGNALVTNSSAPQGIYEFPAVNGIAQFNKQFALFSTYSGNGVGIDNVGDLYYTGYNGGTNLNVAQINAVALGSAAVGTAVSTTPTSVQFTFSSSATPASIAVSGPGFTYTPGTCAAGTAYAAAGNCTVSVNFTPAAAGTRTGAISLLAADGSRLATALLSGIGVGAVETNDPGTVTAIGGSFTSPQGVAVDGTGNVYVADAGANTVLEYVGGTGTGVAVGTGLSKPGALAIDGAGNVYIADSGNGRVVEVPVVNGVLRNAAQTVVASGLGTTLGLALDPAGDLYVSDASKTTISRYGSINGMASSSALVTLGSGFTRPQAVATDGSGNLFVADAGANSVSEITFYGKSQSTIGSGYSQPSGLAADASGSLYVADSGNSRLIRIPLEGTSFNTNDQYLVGSTVAVPYGVAIDGTGNLYVTDNKNLSLSRIDRTSGTLALGRAQINTSTSSFNANIGNAGNAALTFGSPAYAATGNTGVFTVNSPSTNGCAAAASVQPGASCLLSAVFTPTTVGNFTEVLTFSSNAVNAATSTLSLTGRGLNLAATTTTLTQTSAAGAAAFGTPVTIQARIASSTAGTPTGTVSFTVDGNLQTNPPTVSNGVASITLNGLTGGQHTVSASYSGDDNFAPSNGTLSITVNKASSTTMLSFTGGVNTNPTSGTPGSSISLQATVAPGASTAPTGTVTFTTGSLTLGTAALAVQNGGGYAATLTTTQLPTGTDAVVATYSGDINYTSSSSTQTAVISYPTFLMTPATSSLTVTSGQTGSTPLTITSISGFSGYIGITCSGLPANSSCGIDPNGFILSSGTPQTLNLLVLTGQTPPVPPPTVGSFGLPGSGTRGALAMALLTLLPLGLLSRRGRRRSVQGVLSLLLLLLLGGASSMLSGCSGSSVNGVTPSGTYTVTVTAVSTPSTYATSVFAPNCKIQGTSSTTLPTCTQTTTLTLTVR